MDIIKFKRDQYDANNNNNRIALWRNTGHDVQTSSISAIRVSAR